MSSTGTSPSGRPARVTSTDVARAAGVSRATVSYVLNNVRDQSISENTRELVLRTARELGHVPNSQARSLRRGRSDVILVLVRDFSMGYIAGSVLRLVDAALAQDGYVTVVHHYDLGVRTMEEMYQRVTPALVIAMAGLAFDKSSIIAPASGLLMLHETIDNERAGALQAEHLISCGHRRIAYALPIEQNLKIVAEERLRGLTNVLRRAGLAAPDTRVLDPGNVSMIGAALDDWMSAPDVTAVATHNDELALLLRGILASQGVSAGAPPAIIGVDDIPAARVELTTVAIDVEAWSAQIVSIVRRMLEGEKVSTAPVDIFRLIVRNTA